MTQYMHLLDDTPAYFDPKTKAIYFYVSYGKAIPLAKSLRQIRREQCIDRDNKLAHIKHGYCRIAPLKEN